MIAATTFRSVGLVIGLLVAVGVALYAAFNFRSGSKEVGAELELAPNRREYLPDEELEGRKLDLALGLALLFLVIVGVGLPLYWLREPGRQADATERQAETFIGRGETLYEEQCSRCHGGAGAGAVAADYALTLNGSYVDAVDWRAPELSTVLLRFAREEVIDILNYGRPGTPMPAWGEPGGGPLTLQQIENVVDYLGSLQPYLINEFDQPYEVDEDGNPIVYTAADELPEGYEVGDPVPPEEWLRRQEDIDAEVDEVLCQGEFDTAECERQYESRGEALFNMGRLSGFASGAYACGRCHTGGWSYAYPGSSALGRAGLEVPEATAHPGPSGGGGWAFNLWEVDRKFSDAVGPNGKPMLLRTDGDGYALTLPGPDQALATALTDVAVVLGSEPHLARDETGELLVVEDDGTVVDHAGEEVTEIEGEPVVVLPEVAIDAEGAALVQDGELVPVGPTVTFSQSQLDFVKSGSEVGVQYGDVRPSAGTGRMPGFGNLLTDADIAAIVEYERDLTAENARRDWVDPPDESSGGGSP